ncbi:carnitine deficiency-associated protein-like protein [Euroglyphus maynei]|uniref:Carnitine deficiency-associated protein-like protein n=1 Tax=Euroglyphus maynei TaxID=6958 RepID=A0A1Y3AYG9_EURMA|nr:carnitine deficiency-associated protein-like protein [Euroglyphus maynei]
MFERKLLSLQYDRPSVDVNGKLELYKKKLANYLLQDESEFQNIVYWIESMKIRFYPPNDRSCLLAGSNNWNESYEKYLNEINYQGPRDDRKIALDFLLNLALRYEMEDIRTQMQMSTEDVSDMINLDQLPGDVDVSSSEFIEELRSLSQLLNVPFYEEEPLITLRAIAILLCKLRRSSRKTNDNHEQSNNDNNKKQKIVAKVDENILNTKFAKKSHYDNIVNRCANVIRLLYIKDVRELQTEINNAIVQVQSVTANPKTDSSLGQVGR